MIYKNNDWKIYIALFIGLVVSPRSIPVIAGLTRNPSKKGDTDFRQYDGASSRVERLQTN